MLFPKLRNHLDVTIHTEGQGPETESFLVFRCPFGIIKPVVFTTTIGPIISRFTGEASVDEIANTLAPMGATRQLVADVAQLCDENLLLESPRFFEQRHAILEAFRLDPVRRAAHAGGAYPAEKEQLEALVSSYLNHNQSTTAQLVTPPLCALMVPHIDFRRGGTTYGIGYSALKNSQPDVVILVGTAHQASPHLFHLTTKDFALPFQTFRNDAASTALLAHHYGAERSFADEFLHKHEHSLELQLPFLHASLPKTPSIVPILVGSFYPFIREQRLPSESEPYQTFLGALVELCRTISARGESFLLLAGVDMAHRGMAFGDPAPLTPADLEAIRFRDSQYLSHIAARDPKGLFAHIAEDQDAGRMCGFPTMYLLLDLLNTLQLGDSPALLDYQLAFDPASDTCVTFGAAAFTQ
jgi:AmmeMemoRadiSam system protein B